MLYGILHQFDFEVGSAENGFSHNALLTMTADNIALKELLMLSTNVSATKSPTNLLSYKAVITLSLSISYRRAFSMLSIQHNISLPTAAKVITGLQTPPHT